MNSYIHGLIIKPLHASLDPTLFISLLKKLRKVDFIVLRFLYLAYFLHLHYYLFLINPKSFCYNKVRLKLKQIINF